MQVIGWLIFLILSLLGIYGIVASIQRWMTMVRQEMRREWRWIPPPNIRCSRGKQTNCKYGDYW